MNVGGCHLNSPVLVMSANPKLLPEGAACENHSIGITPPLPPDGLSPTTKLSDPPNETWKRPPSRAGVQLMNPFVCWQHFAPLLQSKQPVSPTFATSPPSNAKLAILVAS